MSGEMCRFRSATGGSTPVTKYPDLFAALAFPFDPESVKVRTQGGKQLHYVTSRTVMNRLDEVLGPENWSDHYVPEAHSVLCRLTIRLPDGSMLTKQDAGGYAGMQDEGDDSKSGYSDAFKRAAVKFGVGRYLYRDGVPSFAAEAKAATPTPTLKAPLPPQSSGNGRDNYKQPPPGKAVWAWAKNMEEHFGVALIPEMREIARGLGYGTDFTAWPKEQADQVTGRVICWLSSLDNYNGEFDGKFDVAGFTEKLSGTAQRKTEIVAAIRKGVDLALAAVNVEPTNENRRKLLDEASSRALDCNGNRGTVLEGKLQDCQDVEWLGNIAQWLAGQINQEST